MLVLTKAVGELLSPPGIIIVVAVLGLLIHIRWASLGNFVVGLSLVALLALSLPLTGNQLLSSLEADIKPLPALTPQARANADAIVVLGAGRNADAPEYGGDTVSAMALERLRYAARLHRVTGLPILLSAGSPFAEQKSEAELMQQALEESFQVKAKWIEARSRTTYENARYTKEMLQAAGVRRIYVVTHAWHMPRALWSFRGTGLDVIAAPTGFTRHRPDEGYALGYLPTASGLYHSSRAIHERLGLRWYRFKYGAAEAVARGQINAPAPLP